ncbi:MAG: DUF4465 domain-containing protein [Planctomycetota bacterium]
MKRSSIVTLAVMLAATAQAQTTIDFESLTPRDVTDPNYFASNPGFTTNNTTFAGGSFSGFVVSESTNLAGQGFLFQQFQQPPNPNATAEVSAYALPSGGGADNSDQFAVNFGSSTINLPAGLTPESVELTNTTSAFFSMLNGDSFAKQFGGDTGDDPDFFSVTFTGYDALGGAGGPGNVTGSSTFFLADFTFSDNTQDFIVDDWTFLDLSPLGAARSVGLSFASSDVGDFGINTPLYVALDNLTLIPEPTTFAVLGGLALVITRRRQTA